MCLYNLLLEKSSLFSGHHRGLQILQLPRSGGAQATVSFTSSQGSFLKSLHFGTVSPNNPIPWPFHPGIRGLRIPQLGWGFLNLRIIPFSTLISREENTLQSREMAEGMFPRSSLWGGCVARAQV